MKNREFASIFLTFIKEVHKTIFRQDAIRRTHTFEFYTLLNNGKFCLDFEGSFRPSSDRSDVNVDKCVNDAGIGFTMS
jgi:hypothetical protein